jgi:hypothetical protein
MPTQTQAATTAVVANTGGGVAEQATPPKVRKPRAKPERKIRLLSPLYQGRGPGKVRITIGDEVAEYLITELGVDWPARGFEVAKVGDGAKDGPYHVLIEGNGGSCECRGFLRWGRCRHRDGLAALVARGLL